MRRNTAQHRGATQSLVHFTYIADSRHHASPFTIARWPLYAKHIRCTYNSFTLFSDIFGMSNIFLQVGLLLQHRCIRGSSLSPVQIEFCKSAQARLARSAVFV